MPDRERGEEQSKTHRAVKRRLDWKGHTATETECLGSDIPGSPCTFPLVRIQESLSAFPISSLPTQAHLHG